MQLSLSRQDLQKYIARQLNNFYPDNDIVDLNGSGHIIDIALDRLEYCFKKVAYPARYNKDGQALFNHLYADHYLVFIWFLANTFWKEKQDDKIANKLYYLNKTLHAFDCMYDTGLPDIFLVFHGAGTMLGKANYSNYFVCLQGCTIGSNKGFYPTFGNGVALAAHSCVIGKCHIGDGVSISAFASIYEKDIPGDTVAFTNSESGGLVLKPSKNSYSQQFFNEDIHGRSTLNIKP